MVSYFRFNGLEALGARTGQTVQFQISHQDTRVLDEVPEDNIKLGSFETTWGSGVDRSRIHGLVSNGLYGKSTTTGVAAWEKERVGRYSVHFVLSGWGQPSLGRVDLCFIRIR